MVPEQASVSDGDSGETRHLTSLMTGSARAGAIGKRTESNGGPRMTSQVQTPFLEHQKQLWKARAQAKQKWLEQSLAQSTRTSDDAVWRMTWIKQALDMVERAQAEIKHHAALMDAYTEHLTVLEMTLIAAAEQKRSTEAAANLKVETAERKRGSEASANLSAESGAAAGPRPGDSLKRKHV
jgi:hypothetical protein